MPSLLRSPLNKLKFSSIIQHLGCHVIVIIPFTLTPQSEVRLHRSEFLADALTLQIYVKDWHGLRKHPYRAKGTCFSVLTFM